MGTHSERAPPGPRPRGPAPGPRRACWRGIHALSPEGHHRAAKRKEASGDRLNCAPRASAFGVTSRDAPDRKMEGRGPRRPSDAASRADLGRGGSIAQSTEAARLARLGPLPPDRRPLDDSRPKRARNEVASTCPPRRHLGAPTRGAIASSRWPNSGQVRGRDARRRLAPAGQSRPAARRMRRAGGSRRPCRAARRRATCSTHSRSSKSTTGRTSGRRATSTRTGSTARASWTGPTRRT